MIHVVVPALDEAGTIEVLLPAISARVAASWDSWRASRAIW